MSSSYPFSRQPDEERPEPIDDLSAANQSRIVHGYVPLATPRLTYGLIALNLFVFLGMIVYGFVQYNDWNGTENARVLIDFGAKVNELVAIGQYWRLLTAMFLHIGVMHLLFNLYSLYSLGMLAEGYFGHLRFGAIYLLGGLFGSAASYAFSRSLSAGASGAIFALAGAITIYLIYYRENLGERGRSILQNMLIIIAINLAFGFANPGIDNWGHVGGLVGGALTAWGVMPRYETPALSMLAPQPLRLRQQPARDLTWVAGCATLLVLSVWWVTRGYLGI